MAFKLPISYQGGKHRIANKILDVIDIEPTQHFYDICCGSGAMSIALLNRGHPPNKITMVDAGPWGYLWSLIGSGKFDLAKFEDYIAKIPKDPAEIHAHITALANRPIPLLGEDIPYVFLILQAASFGGKAIWLRPAGRGWDTHGFRKYWTPTAISARRYSVNPMMPMPDTILERIKKLIPAMVGMQGFCTDAARLDYFPEAGSIVYVDPPYDNTSAYGYKLDRNLLYDKFPDCRIFVSEGKALSDKSWMIAKNNKKGGISGNRAAAHEEWLSEISVAKPHSMDKL